MDKQPRSKNRCSSQIKIFILYFNVSQYNRASRSRIAYPMLPVDEFLSKFKDRNRTVHLMFSTRKHFHVEISYLHVESFVKNCKSGGRIKIFYLDGFFEAYLFYGHLAFPTNFHLACRVIIRYGKPYWRSVSSRKSIKQPWLSDKLLGSEYCQINEAWQYKYISCLN